MLVRARLRKLAGQQNCRLGSHVEVLTWPSRCGLEICLARRASRGTVRSAITNRSRGKLRPKPPCQIAEIVYGKIKLARLDRFRTLATGAILQGAMHERGP